jgi:acetyl esterase
MPAEPHTQQILDLLAAAAPAEPVDPTPETSREAYRGLSAMMPQGPDVSVVDRTIPGPAGDIPVRIYRPEGDGPFGVLVHLHGGGWTIGDLDTHDHPCRTLCQEAGVVVVAVDYRLAPEDPFPAAVDDSWAALEWVAEHAAEIDGDPARLAIGGDSAGGNLAAVIALMARDAGGPQLRLQLLVYPSVDNRSDHTDRYPSLLENAEGKVLTLTTMTWFAANYLPDESSRTDWRASPLLADDHSGLAPAHVVSVGLDPLRDEGRAYAEVLAAAGNDVTHAHYDGTVHTVWQLAPVIPLGATALSEASARLRDTIGSA